ncbi:MAG: putative General transcription and DNA repair factor IIH helicase subunit XPB [Streblomastix strix]|uniref:DNA 3'-5' helicase n=1 Tax=Streblomastix strix TaxID=222440 RepID=A0A5J4URZ2_9EUKA|nr:MAG: putative General transcription and DNA repair factor IIH helicase subunit XPB [Streblomastix strix]
MSGTGIILITTYSMLTHTGHRSAMAEDSLKKIEAVDWGLLVFDEVHVVPASSFRQVISRVRAHTKLGLTATLVREDKRITDLIYLIGPKLYEANWKDLEKEGFLSRVQCIEVPCPMSQKFFRSYLRADSNKKQLLYMANPTKFQVVEYLIRFHEQRKDKILCVSDNIFTLETYAIALHQPYLYGGSTQEERDAVLEDFKNNPDNLTLFISKIGDTSIDLPDANVLIQITSHFGSRRQEAQRMGRILRPKKTEGEFNAFFYTLVSQDTKEAEHAEKRMKFLVDQGYSYRTILSLEEIPLVRQAQIDYNQGISSEIPPAINSPKYQIDEDVLLSRVMNADKDDSQEEQPIYVQLKSDGGIKISQPKALSGGANLNYSGVRGKKAEASKTLIGKQAGSICKIHYQKKLKYPTSIDLPNEKAISW